MIAQSNGKGHFSGSTLRTFQFPSNLEKLDYYALDKCKPNMESIVVPATCTHVSRFGNMSGGYIGKWIVRHKMTTFAPGYSRCGSIKATNLPVWVLDYPEVQPFSNLDGGGGNNYFYVPDNLVASYKADSRWANAVNNIYPISELPG